MTAETVIHLSQQDRDGIMFGLGMAAMGILWLAWYWGNK